MDILRETKQERHLHTQAYVTTSDSICNCLPSFGLSRNIVGRSQGATTLQKHGADGGRKHTWSGTSIDCGASYLADAFVQAGMHLIAVEFVIYEDRIMVFHAGSGQRIQPLASLS